MENRAYEIVEDRYEPKIGQNIAQAITHAVEDIPVNTVGKFGLDAERFVRFTSNDRPRDVWDRLHESLNENS